MSKEMHWFNFSFSHEHGNSSSITGYEGKNITLKMIDENREYAGASDNSVLLAVSYLGFMTREQMKGEG